MSESNSRNGDKNLIGKHLAALRQEHDLSQRHLATLLQLQGLDVDKNVITRIETGKRHVSDIEINELCRVVHYYPVVLFHLNSTFPSFPPNMKQTAYALKMQSLRGGIGGMVENAILTTAHPASSLNRFLSF